MTYHKSQLDVVIIGGGPAGMSTALWCEHLGLSVVLIEKEKQVGGQMAFIHNPIQNYLGLEADNGSILTMHFARMLSKTSYQTECELVRADLSTKTLSLADGVQVRPKAIVIATGVRRRALGIPGENEFYGSGILRSGAGEKETTKGKVVLIVGGGDAAVENASILSDFADKVIVIHRGDRLSARPELIKHLSAKKNIEVMLNSIALSIEGETSVSSVMVADTLSGGTRMVDADAVLIRIGVLPNSDLFRDQLATDDSGYFKVGNYGETEMPGIYAIGDVANPLAPTISTAVGTGAMAAKHLAKAVRSWP